MRQKFHRPARRRLDAKRRMYNRRLQYTVNARNYLCLTDFLNRTFAGENAKNRNFAAGINKTRPPFTISALIIYRRYENGRQDTAVILCELPLIPSSLTIDLQGPLTLSLSR
ncbi:MAG: hypothetical protein ACLPPF_01910, partial [Rhodomicrobium sp.]